MELGVYIAPGAAVEDVGEFAAAVEAAGFDALWLPEHPVMPVDVTSAFPGVGDEIPPAYGRLPDPIVLLAVAAGRTTTLRLATGICLVGLRNPLVFAKQVATLDRVSQGRVVLGVGAGWLREEYEVVTGEPFAQRWARTVDIVSALRALWTGEAAYAGTHVSFPAVRSEPRPESSPPVVVGGSSDAALRAALEVGDAWLPVHAGVDEIVCGRRRLDELASELGRRNQLAIFAFGGPAKFRDPDELGVLRDAGVAQVVMWIVEGRDPADQLAELSAVAARA